MNILDFNNFSDKKENCPKFYLAPMVRYSKLAFRQLVRLYNVDVCYTPMIYAKNFLESEKCRNSELSVCEGDSPLIVQFATDDPIVLAEAAEMVYACSNGVDLNCGCPKHDVRSKGFGSALLLKCQLNLIDAEDDEDERIYTTTTSSSSVTTAKPTTSTTASVSVKPLQKASSFSSSITTSSHVNAPVESMEGHSSLASYSHHSHHQHHSAQLSQQHSSHLQDFQSTPSASHPYYHEPSHQQQQYSQSASSNNEGQTRQLTTYGSEYDQASTSSAGPSGLQQQQQTAADEQHQHQQNHNQQFQLHTTSSEQRQQIHSSQGPPPQYEPPPQALHTVRYEQLPQQPMPHSAPPLQRTHMPQYPVKVVDASLQYSQSPLNRNTNSGQPKPLPPLSSLTSSSPSSNTNNHTSSDTPPSAPAVVAPRKTPPSFVKRQPDAKEQQRVDFEVARNVSQIMSKNGMKPTQEATAPRSLPPLAPLAPLPSLKSTNYQCPNCNKPLANARNLQRHRQSCGSSTISSSMLPLQKPQQAAPQLAAMLQRSPPTPCASAPPSQVPLSASSGPTIGFQHHNSTGNLTLGYNASTRQQSSLYSPQEIVRNPNVMLSDGFDFKDDPLLYPGTSCSDSLWPRDDSFQSSEPHSASHDQMDLDRLGFPDPLHDPLLDSYDTDQNKEALRNFNEPEELTTLDPNPQCSEPFYGISLDPELEMPLSLDCEEPLMRSESASLSSSSQGRNTPATGFSCEACKKMVSSERSLRRHHNTCKSYQADYGNAVEERPTTAPAQRKPTAKRAKKKEPEVNEKNSAILAALRKEQTPQAQYHNPQQNYQMVASSSTGQFQHPYGGGTLPSISASWLQSSSSSSFSTYERSAMFTPPIASSTPNPYQQQQQQPHKSSPLEDLLNEEDTVEDGDSRSSNGTSANKPIGNPLFSCEHCARQLCSMSNLKRHRATCKAAASLSTYNSVSNPPSEPVTPAATPLTGSTSVPTQGPLLPQSQSQQPQHQTAPETTATVTYTKTNVPGGTNTWSSDKGQLISPKQKISSAVIMPLSDSSLDGNSGGNSNNNGKFVTVGEALRAQQHQQRMDNNMHMQYQQRFQQQHLPQNSRIPPRPPNPILNQVQNPPQQVQQNQIQTQIGSSRQGPPAHHQNIHQQLPPLRLQSPPTKRGLIEHKNTDLVLITSEPLTDRRPQHLQPLQNPQESMESSRRSSDGPAGATLLPPIQLPQRNQSQRPQQQQQCNSQPPIAYQVQFNGRPLPPVQLPPHQSQLQQIHQKQQSMKKPPISQSTNNPSMSQPQQMSQPFNMQYQQMTHSMPQVHQVQQSQASGNRSRSHSTVSKNDGYGGKNGDSINQNPPGSPLDSIITSVPLSIEVHHNAMKQGPPEQGQSSVDSQSTAEPSPRKSHQQAYICPECQKTYSCRKNVKRHRMAVHKLSLEDILAKPEQPAPETASVSIGGRRHTIAGLETAETPKKESGAGTKRKASAAVASTAAKKGKEMADSVEVKSDEVKNEECVEHQEPPKSIVSLSPTMAPLPPAHTIMSRAHSVQKQYQQHSQPATHNVQNMCQILNQDDQFLVQDQRASFSNQAHSSRPSSNMSVFQQQQQNNGQLPNMQNSMSLSRPPSNAPPPAQSPVFQSQVQMPPPPPYSHASAPNPTHLNQVQSSSMSLALPPLQLPPLQSSHASIMIENPSPSWASHSMPNSALPITATKSSTISTSRNSRSIEFSDEEDTRAMAKIAAELKRSAEDWPVLAVIEGVTAQPENGEEIDEDELLMKRLRQGGVLEDVGDVSDLLMNTHEDNREADSTFTEELIDKTAGQVPPLSQASSVGLPSLASPEEQYLQQSQQVPYQQYPSQHNHVWSNSYDHNYHHQIYMHQEQNVQQQQQLSCMQPSQGNLPMNNSSQINSQQLLQQKQHHYNSQNIQQQQFQEPLPLQHPQRPSSQPANQSPRPLPAVKPTRRASNTPRTNHTCTGCKKILGSDYSLRRHRAGCAGVQKVLNPEYPRPPKRKAAREARKVTEAEILASMPKPLDPQVLAERKAAAAEAAVERIGALPPPSVVHEIVNQVNAEREMLKKNQTASPPVEEEARTTNSSDDVMSSSTSSTSSTSPISSIQGGPQPIKNQARHMCQECGKLFSSEWNLERHRREACKVIKIAHSYEPISPSDHADLIFMDKSKRKVSRAFLSTVSSLISYWLEKHSNRLELDTKWEDFQLLLDVHTLKVGITADNVQLIAEQSKKYQLKHVVQMAEQFMMQTSFVHH